MARMPGAKWRPITTRNYTPRTTTKDCIILHSTGSAAATSMYGWFNNPAAGVSSHFHIDNAGNIEQYVDTAHMSWANAAANSRSITIETQGNGRTPWTAAQIRAIVRIVQWARSVHRGIPLRQMTSSASTQKGIGWHRLGVNGNFPRSGILRGRNQRGVGQSWSRAYGKVCPGDDRIKQIPAIIRQANGHTTPATTTPSSPKKERTWLEMVSKNELRALLREEGWAYKGSGESWDAYSYLRNTYRGVQRLEKEMSNVPINVWRYKGSNENRDAYSYLRNTLRNTAALQGENEGLLKALQQVGNVDVDEVRKAAQEGVQKALDSLEADVTLNVDTSEGE